MLADQLFDANCSPVAEDDDNLFPLTRKTSVLKKTMKALGKVKPKFNSNSGKMKRGHMEYVDSCSSFDFEFDTTEDSTNDRTANSDNAKSDSEIIVQDDEIDDMKVRANESSVVVKSQDSVVCGITTQNVKNESEESDVDTDGKPNKASTSVFARARKLTTRSNSVVHEVATPHPVSGMPVIRPFSVKSKRHSLPLNTVQVDESTPASKVTYEKPTVKTTPHLTPAALTEQLHDSSPAPAEQKMPAPTMLAPATIERNPLVHPSTIATSADTSAKKISTNAIVESGVDLDVPQNQAVDGETTWKRLSRAFESIEKGKSHEKDTKQETDQEMVDDPYVVEEDGNYAAKGQNNSLFKTPKRIKKMFGMNRSKIAPKINTREGVSDIDEAAIVMKELNAITLSPVQGDPPSKPGIGERPRPIDDMSAHEHSMEYPEVPSTKTVSLVDIRNFVWRRETTSKQKNIGPNPHKATRDSPNSDGSNVDRECRSSSDQEKSMESATLSNDENERPPRRSSHLSSRSPSLDHTARASETAPGPSNPLEGAIENDNGADVHPAGRIRCKEDNLKRQHTSRRRHEARSHNRPRLPHGASDRKVTVGNGGVAEESSTHPAQRSRRSRTNHRRVSPGESMKPESRSSDRDTDHPGINDGVEGTLRRKRSARRLEPIDRCKNGHRGPVDHSNSQELGEVNTSQHSGKNLQPTRNESIQGTRWRRNVRRVDEKQEGPSSSLAAVAIDNNTESVEPAALTTQPGAGDNENDYILGEKRSAYHISRRRKPSTRRINIHCSGDEVSHERSKNKKETSLATISDSPTTKDAENLEIQRSSVSSRGQSHRSIRSGEDKGPRKQAPQRSSLHPGQNRSDEESNTSRRNERSNHDKPSGLSNIGEEKQMKESSGDPAKPERSKGHRSKSRRRQPVPGTSAKKESVGRIPPSMTNLEQGTDVGNMTFTRNGSRRPPGRRSEKHSEGFVVSPADMEGTSARNQESDLVDDEKEDTPDKAKNVKSQRVSLYLERDSLANPRLFVDDGQQTVMTDDGSQWFGGNVSYSNIKSSASVSAAQLVFGSTVTTTGGKSLGEPNVQSRTRETKFVS